MFYFLALKHGHFDCCHYQAMIKTEFQIYKIVLSELPPFACSTLTARAFERYSQTSYGVFSCVKFTFFTVNKA